MVFIAEAVWDSIVVVSSLICIGFYTADSLDFSFAWLFIVHCPFGGTTTLHSTGLTLSLDLVLRVVTGHLHLTSCPATSGDLDSLVLFLDSFDCR